MRWEGVRIISLWIGLLGSGRSCELCMDNRVSIKKILINGKIIIIIIEGSAVYRHKNTVLGHIEDLGDSAT
jgi:hypothetical protein